MIRYGDLQLIPYDEHFLVIACDSSGGIGNKAQDVVPIEPESAGYYAAAVPLIEIMAARAQVISLVDTLCVEMEPTGKRIIQGIQDAMSQIGIDPNLLTGSTEDNIKTQSTGIGVTVIGKMSREEHQKKQIPEQALLVLIGIPKVGAQFLTEEVIGTLGETLTLADMRRLLNFELIKDMIPVGSKGILYEGAVLAKRYGLNIVWKDVYYREHKIDLETSAGPSTCLLVAVEKEHYQALLSYMALNRNTILPIHCIGEFFKEER